METPLPDVRRIAELACLDLDPAAADRMKNDLERILVCAAAIDAVGSEAALPAAPTPGSSRSLRDDSPAISLTVEEALAGAPDAGSGHFKVPRALPE